MDMTPLQALILLDGLVAELGLKREQHARAMQATAIIRRCLMAPDTTDDEQGGDDGKV